MRLLLDSCTLLWSALNASELSPCARQLLESTKHELFLSFATFWELNVKLRVGKLSIPEPIRDFFSEAVDKLALQVLPIDGPSVMRLIDLPALHRDPFDRSLMSTAIERELTIFTPDQAIRQYGVRVEL